MHYRVYGLNESDGRIVATGDILAEGDEEAIRVGQELYPEAAFEIWCKDRKVLTQGLMVKTRSGATR